MSVRTSLACFGQRVHAVTASILTTAASQDAASMDRRAPADSGELRDSIVATLATPGPVVVTSVVVRSHHAAAVEFGTADTPPHPFIRPTAREAVDRLSVALKTRLRQATRGH